MNLAPRTPLSLTVAAVKQLRPKQWAKNVFLFAALIFSGRFLDPMSVVNALIGFFAFCMLSSSGYILNDALDVEADRKHPKKKFRPIASGALPMQAAMVLMVSTLSIGVVASWSLGPMFLVAGLGYLATTLSYSFYFKHKVILDVMFLSGCFVIRALAGAAAITVPVSPWFFICTAFLALFFGFNKRRAELRSLGADGGTRKNLVEYNPQMLQEYQSISTSCAVLSYSLYTVLGPTPWMVLTIPYVVYAFFRYIYLVEGKGEGGAPDETLLQDWPMLVTVSLYVLTACAVLYLNGDGTLDRLLR